MVAPVHHQLKFSLSELKNGDNYIGLWQYGYLLVSPMYQSSYTQNILHESKALQYYRARPHVIYAHFKSCFHSLSDYNSF